MRQFFLPGFLAFALVLPFAGCMHITMDVNANVNVNVKLDKALNDFFGDFDKSSATMEVTPPSSSAAPAVDAK